MLSLLPIHHRTWGLSTYLCHLVLTPETRIVKGYIAMLIHCIDVSLILQQLRPTAQKRKRQSVSPCEILVSRHEETKNSTHSSHDSACYWFHSVYVRCGWGRACMYLLYNVTVSMTSCQVQGGIIPSIHHIDPCSPHDQHFNHRRAAFSAGPVQGGEAMIIPLRKGQDTKLELGRTKVTEKACLFRT